MKSFVRSNDDESDEMFKGLDMNFGLMRKLDFQVKNKKLLLNIYYL